MNYEVIDEVIANYLKRGRRMRNVTQREFAAELEIPYSTYACYETAKRSMPLDVFEKACRLLGYNPRELMQEAADAYAKTFEK